MKTILSKLLVVIVLLAAISTVRAQEKNAAAPASPFPSQPGAQPSFAPGKGMFQPMNVDQNLLQQSFKAQSEYRELNRRIETRQRELMTQDAKLAELQSKMKDLQKKIDVIIADDPEMKKLKEKSQAMSPDFLSMPKKDGAPGASPFKNVNK